MRKFWRIVGAASIYYATLSTIYYVGTLPLDCPHALSLEKHSLMVALRDYRKEHKAYPILPDNPIGDLKKQLVSGGYLPPGPDVDKDARYASLDGKDYGLLFHIDRTLTDRFGTPCLTEFDAIKAKRWDGARKCPF